MTAALYTAKALILQAFVYLQALYFQVMGGGSKGCSLSSDMWLDCITKVELGDPACGTGGMLIEAIRNMDDQRASYGRIYGQEKNLSTSAIARMNLFLHGAREFKIIREDTLQRPQFIQNGELQRFDCVLANPPSAWINGARSTSPTINGAETFGAARRIATPTMPGYSTWFAP